MHYKISKHAAWAAARMMEAEPRGHSGQSIFEFRVCHRIGLGAHRALKLTPRSGATYFSHAACRPDVPFRRR